MKKKESDGVAVHDALRLAVLFRSNRDELGILARMSGIPVATLERFALTGDISARDRAVLEVYQ
jgi:hypothetical protein